MVLLFTGTVLLWWVFGLSEYARVVWAINALEGSVRDKYSALSVCTNAQDACDLASVEENHPRINTNS